jgi:hypothetical protein
MAMAFISLFFTRLESAGVLMGISPMLFINGVSGADNRT